MTNWTQIDSERLPGGSELTLYRDGNAFMIRADGLELMNSGAHGSEEAFVALGFEAVPDAKAVLVGGLGLGYTLSEVLRRLPPHGKARVCEISAKVISWNQDIMNGLNPGIWKDERVEVLHSDLVDHIRSAEDEDAGLPLYDLALLDIDNGPEALVHPGNDKLYSVEGLDRLCSLLEARGAAVFWSAFPSDVFRARLAEFFSTVRVEIFSLPQNPKVEHVLFIASHPLRDRSEA